FTEIEDNLEKKHEKEIEILKKSQEGEEKEEERELEEKMKSDHMDAISQLEEERKAQLKATKSKEEKARLLAEYKKKSESLADFYTGETDRQVLLLKRKREARQIAAQIRQAQKQKEERDRLEITKEQELQQLKKKAEKEKEKRAIVAAVSNIGESTVPEIVELAVQRRHAKEMEDLLQKQRKERESDMEKEKEDALGDYYKRKDELLSKHSAEVNDLIKRHQKDPHILVEQRDRMQERHKEEENAFEEQERKRRSEIDNSDAQAKKQRDKERDNKFFKERIALRHTQMAEFVEIMRDLFPKLLPEVDEEVERAQEELEQMKGQLSTNVAKELDKMKENAEKYEEEQRRKLEKDKEFFLKKLEKREQLEKKRVKESRAAFLERQAQFISEQEKQQADEAQGLTNVGAQQRAAVLQSHQAARARLEHLLVSEEKSQEDMIKAMMAKRKKVFEYVREMKQKKTLQSQLRQRQDLIKKKIMALKDEEEARKKESERTDNDMFDIDVKQFGLEKVPMLPGQLLEAINGSKMVEHLTQIHGKLQKEVSSMRKRIRAVEAGR
ncbi:hypothetical protein ADUPG1_005992, partial [Aduncisulcus paluster]